MFPIHKRLFVFGQLLTLFSLSCFAQEVQLRRQGLSELAWPFAGSFYLDAEAGSHGSPGLFYHV